MDSQYISDHPVSHAEAEVAKEKPKAAPEKKGEVFCVWRGEEYEFALFIQIHDEIVNCVFVF